MVLDIVDLMQGLAMFACPIIAFVLFFKDNDVNYQRRRPYSKIYWNFFLKKWWAYLYLPKGKEETSNYLPTQEEEKLEGPKTLDEEENVDGMTVFGMDQKGNKIHLKVTHKRHRMVEVWLLTQLENGTIYQLPNHPDTVVHDNLSHSWSVGGLKLQMCEPLRRWRISFNGLLRRGPRNHCNAEANEDDLEHIRFSFIWSACSRPFHVQSDWSRTLKSHALAKVPWRDGEWLSMGNELGDGYDQWGTLCGTWTGADSVAKVFLLQGIRQRLWSDDQVVWQHRRVDITGVVSDGLFFRLLTTSSRRGLTQATFGHVRQANGIQFAIDWCDISLPDLGEHRDRIPKHFVIHFLAGGVNYTLVVDIESQHETTMFGGRPWDQEVRVLPFQCAVNSHQGTGVAEFWYRYSGKCPVKFPAPIHHLRLCDGKPGPLVVTFEDLLCQSSNVVGGKGSSLALMTSFNYNQLNVPAGFCLTVSALERQLQEYTQLRDAIDTLQQISCCQVPGDLKEQCDRTVNLIESTAVCETVAAAVSKHLRLLDSSLPVAIRSSGVGEDSEELSAAGQNATILGQQHCDVLTAVAKCWASLYAFQSVQYRRQHGQEVACGMGVVVQVMIPADSAGVLFTRHPITGNPAEIIITANYGLGESVVSAMVEPDTVLLSRNLKDELSVANVQCGSKAHKVAMTASGGVETTSVGSMETSQLCITHEEALALGRLGIQLEAMFGGPRDIEWAIQDGVIHLLQARPITSLDSWSDFDLLHEFDSPITTDTELLTIANTGEVFPGAITPLTGSWIVFSLEQSIVANTVEKKNRSDFNYYTSKVMVTSQHVMLNILNTMMSNPESKITAGNKVTDLAVYGHVVTTPEMHRLGCERNGAMDTRKKMKVTFGMVKDAYYNVLNVKRAKKLSLDFHLASDGVTSADQLYAEISTSFYYLFEATRCHSRTSSVSLFSQIVAMSVLMEGQEEFTADHFSDISYLLSSCSNVVSAEIPTDLKAMSDIIISTGLGAEFASLPPGEAMGWLEQHSSSCADNLKGFLQRNQHRGIREFELITETWGMKPELVITSLQATVNAANGPRPAAAKQEQADVDVGLRSTKKTGTKMALKWLMSWCQSSVARREDTKSSLIAIVHQCRLAYRRLGVLLMNDGRIPDADLVFFFTHYELGQILRMRDSLLLAKAIRRKRLWTQWDQLSFPEIVQGLPMPNSILPSSSLENCVRLQGTAVCTGTVMGRACVVLKLDEISQLKAGDILITHSTDIGWSPYFPMLGGVVTELGGLISHGAVVAREYGLPCIVGAQSATSIFKTGDTVLLVGNAGTLEKIDGTREVVNS